MNILYMTADTGGGHVKAAQALMHQSEKQIPGCKSMLVDSLKFISRQLIKLLQVHTTKP